MKYYYNNENDCNLPEGYSEGVCFNIEDYAKALETTVDRLEKDMYNYTDCGAWITWDEDGITIGSIVEGSDAEFEQSFAFPFEKEEVDIWIDELEHLVEDAWIEANGEEE